MALLNGFFAFEIMYDFYAEGGFSAIGRRFRTQIELACYITLLYVVSDFAYELYKDIHQVFSYLFKYEQYFEMIIFLRLAKTIELLEELEQIRVVVQTLKRMVEPITSLTCVIFLMYYIYIVIGMSYFGGLITKDADVYSSCNLPTSSGYYLVNFNDFLSSIVSLFAFMIINNWFVMANQFVCAAGSRLYLMYFVIFYYTIALISVNVIVSFVLDIYDSVTN